MQQLRAWFEGTVQGVGFRYSTLQIARRFSVKGYVRNLADGRVELVAEGDEATLEQFLAAVNEGPMRHYIHDRTIQFHPAEGRFEVFEISA